jgi:hypothetical protein
MSITGEFIRIASETVAIGTGETGVMTAGIVVTTVGMIVVIAEMTAEMGRGDSKHSGMWAPVMFSMTGVSSVLIC